MSEEKKLEDKVKDLQKAVETLITLETERAKREAAKLQTEVKQEEQKVNKEEVKEELKEVHLGELVSYAIKKDLIKRGTSLDDKD